MEFENKVKNKDEIVGSITRNGEKDFRLNIILNFPASINFLSIVNNGKVKNFRSLERKTKDIGSFFLS